MDKPIPFEVLDGDTFRANGTTYRLAGVDAPEIAHGETAGQAYSLESANKLAELLATGNIKITPQSRDENGRVIASVTAGDLDVSQELVRTGAAWSYDRYNDGSAIKALATEARNARRGLWAQGALNPEVFRVTGDPAEGGMAIDPNAQRQRTVAQEVGAGLARGVDQTQAMGAAGIGALARASGLDSLAAWAQESFDKNMAEAAKNKATIADFGDAKTAEDWARFAVGAVAEQAPQLAMDLGAALAAAATEGAAGVGYIAIRRGVQAALEKGVVRSMSARGLTHGYVASSYMQNLGETDQAMLREGVNNPLAAMAAAVPIAALDTVTDAALLRTARRYAVGGNAVKMAEVLWEAGINTAREGVTEGMQEFLKNTAIMTQKAGFDPLADEHLHEYMNSAIIGAIVGGTVTGGGGALRVAADKVLGAGGKTASTTEGSNDQNLTKDPTQTTPETVQGGADPLAAAAMAGSRPVVAGSDAAVGTTPVGNEQAVATADAAPVTPASTHDDREHHVIALDQLLSGNVPEIALPRSKVSALFNGGYFDGTDVSFAQDGDTIYVRRGPKDVVPSQQKAAAPEPTAEIQTTQPTPQENVETVADSAPVAFSVGNPEQVAAQAQPPRVQLQTASWLNESAQAERDLADRLGATPVMEGLFAEGLTAKQVELELLKRGLLGRMPKEDRAGFVTSVRATLGIPSRMSDEGKADFSVWKEAYDKRTKPVPPQPAKGPQAVDPVSFADEPGLSAPIEPYEALSAFVRGAAAPQPQTVQPAPTEVVEQAGPSEMQAAPAQNYTQAAPEQSTSDAAIPFMGQPAKAPAPTQNSVAVDHVLAGRLPQITLPAQEAEALIAQGVFDGQDVAISADGDNVTVRNTAQVGPRKTAKVSGPTPVQAPRHKPGPKLNAVRTATAVVRKVRKDFGINSEVEVLVDNGLDAPAAVTFKDGKATITLNLDALAASDFGDGLKASTEELVEVAVAHEMGHVAMAELAHAMPAKVLQELREVFEAKRANLPKSHAYNKNSAAAGFDEFLSDEFANYLRGRQLGIRVETRRWFTRIRDKLADIVGRISTAIFGEDRLQGTAVAYRVMESIFRARNGIEGATSKEQGYYDTLLADVYNHAAGAKVAERRGKVWELATGEKVRVSARRDISVAQLMANSGHVASTVIGLSKSIIRDPKKATRTLTEVATKVYRELPLLITADEELRAMGAGGKAIADSYKKQMQDTKYTHAVWRRRLEKVMSSLPESAQKDFAMSGVIPQEITKYMEDFYEYVRPMLRTLGNFSNYIPHNYIQAEVSARVEEFAKLIQSEAAKEGVVISDEEALNTAQEVAAGRMGYDADDVTQIDLHGPGLSASNARTLWFMTTGALLQHGFISNDLRHTIDQYVHSTLRRAHYERDMSGYSNTENIEQALLNLGVDEATASTMGSNQQQKTLHRYLSALTIPDLRPGGNPRARLNGHDLERVLAAPGDADFYTKNAWAINWALHRGYLKERPAGKQSRMGVGIDPKTGKLARSPIEDRYMYYDRNKNLRQYVRTIDSANGSAAQKQFPNMSMADWRKKFSRDKARISKILAAYHGTLGLDTLTPTARNYMSNVMAVENWLTMLFSATSSLADLAGVVFRQRTMAGATDAIGQIANLVLTQKGRERLRMAEDFGYGERALATQAFLELNGLQYQSAWAQKANNLLFKANGQMALNHFTRTLGAVMAERFIVRNIEDAKAGGAKGRRAVRYLSELGLTPAEASHMLDADYKHFSEHVALGDHSDAGKKAMAKSKKIFDAISKFSDSAISTPDATQRPVWGSDPRWMLVWHFKSFMFSYYKTIMKPTFNEAVTRYKESGGGAAARAAEAAVPLLLMAIPVMGLSAAGLWLRQLLQYRMFGQDAPTAEMGAAEYTKEVIKRGGLLGPWEMGYTMTNSGLQGKSGLVQLLGPTVGHLDTILSFDAGRIAGRSVPVFSQVPAMREWAGSFFNVD